MVRTLQKTINFNEEENALVERASEKSALAPACFIRTSAIGNARRFLEREDHEFLKEQFGEKAI